MNPEIKSKWLEALRSGRYHQARGVLRAEDGKSHCCLGVLCDILQPDGWGEEWEFEDPSGRFVVLIAPHTLSEDEDQTLSLSTLDAIGLASTEEDTLITMNDDGQDFFAIAWYIDENL